MENNLELNINSDNLIFNGEFYFNIVLHVTILFTILSIFFITFVTKVSSNAINEELSTIIDKQFDTIDKKSINNTYNSLMSNFTNIATANNLINQKDTNQIPNINPSSILNYYTKLFSGDDINRQHINTTVINDIKHFNVFIYIILILFTIVLFKTKNLNFGEVKHIMIENFITFFFVGIIEVLFFMNIALKYIPAPPSIIFTSLIDTLKNNFSN